MKLITLPLSSSSLQNDCAAPFMSLLVGHAEEGMSIHERWLVFYTVYIVLGMYEYYIKLEYCR
jgi:hypothetical protein